MTWLPSAIERRKASAAHFATTQWSCVRTAGARPSGQQREALEALCRTYWRPIYAFLRRQGLNHPDAQDLTQMFLAHLLSRNCFAELAPEKGRFRTFLLRCLKHFLADQHDRAMTAKRGGRQRVISLDAAAADLADESGINPARAAERAFDRQWALSTMEHALARLEAEFQAAGKGDVFAALKPFLSQTVPDGAYAALSRRLGLSSGTVTVMVHRLRRRYGELVREALTRTVGSSADLEAELDYLIQLVCQPGVPAADPASPSDDRA